MAASPRRHAVGGGITRDEHVAEHLRHVDGVMVGREAYHNPWWLAGWDVRHWGDGAMPQPRREAVEAAMVAYMERLQAEEGEGWYAVARHMLGLRHGLPGARRWRQVWSDHRLKALPAREVWALARTPAHGAAVAG
jgi:tRNA-dihydrouridine synthase A